MASKSEDNYFQTLKCERIKNTWSDTQYLEKCTLSQKATRKMCSSKVRSKPGKRRMGYRKQYRTQENPQDDDRTFQDDSWVQYMEGNPRMIKQVKRSWENRAFLECLKAISVVGKYECMKIFFNYKMIYKRWALLWYGPKGKTETDW